MNQIGDISCPRISFTQRLLHGCQNHLLVIPQRLVETKGNF